MTTSASPLRRTLLFATSLSMAGCFAPDDGSAPAEDTDADDPTGGGQDLPPGSGPGTTGDAPQPEPDPADPEPEDTDGDTDGGGEVEDTEAPTIVSTSPADGAAGILADVEFVIEFSEPMDREATELAWSSETLAAEDVTMSWNEAGTVLTVVPNDPLSYANDAEIADPEPLGYGFSIDATAADAAGNTLADAHDVSFTTARELSAGLPVVASLSGSIQENGSFWQNNVEVGDNNGALETQGVVAFDLSVLPPGIVSVKSAELQLAHVYDYPGTWDNLGELGLYEADYVSIESAFDSQTTLLASFCSLGAPQTCTVDVAEVILADLEADETTARFLLAFEPGTNGDDGQDFVRFMVDEASYSRIFVSLLAE